MRVLAVDWSGARQNPRQGIRVAEAGPSGLVSVRDDLDRDGVEAHVREVAAAGPVVVGLDFSFALPAWFPWSYGCADVAELWTLAASEGETWLADEAPPFWGRRTRRPPLHADRPGFRATEERLRDHGLTPSSTFQIGGAGAVGTMSVRGMPHLSRLRSAGAAIWPFDAPGEATVVEIYPSVWTGGARRHPSLRRARLAQDPRVAPGLLDLACESDHAFDAAVSALAMHGHLDELCALPAARAGTPEAIEGAVWLPAALGREWTVRPRCRPRRG